MRKDTSQKYTALIIGIFAIILALWQPMQWRMVGIYDNSPIWHRITYHFFHANILHAVINVWCMLACVFIAKLSWRQILMAFIIACFAPAEYKIPTIGLSGVCYAMLGIISVYAKKQLAYHAYITFCIALTWMFLADKVNNPLHLYCYLAGITYEYFYKLKIKKQ